MPLRKFVSLTCIVALSAALVACKQAGSEYVGKWRAKGDKSHAIIEIVRNGDSFVIMSTGGQLPLTLDKESNTLKSGAFMSISYVKASDTLLDSAGAELERVK